MEGRLTCRSRGGLSRTTAARSAPEAGGDRGDADLFAHALVDHGSEDDVRVRIGRARDGACGLIDLRQAEIRGVADEAASYRDYVLGTGRLHAVWQLADRTFALAGFELRWDLAGDDPLRWSAAFAGSSKPAVVVDPAFIRPADPHAIAADPSRVAAELGWTPEPGLDRFLVDMLDDIGQ